MTARVTLPLASTRSIGNGDDFLETAEIGTAHFFSDSRGGRHACCVLDDAFIYTAGVFRRQCLPSRGMGPSCKTGAVLVNDARQGPGVVGVFVKKSLDFCIGPGQCRKVSTCVVSQRYGLSTELVIFEMRAPVAAGWPGGNTYSKLMLFPVPSVTLSRYPGAGAMETGVVASL